MKKYFRATYLCLKYPFLYPRNRFTDLHHTNWNIHDYLYGKGGLWQKKSGGIRDKAYENIIISLDTPDPDGSHFRNIKYRKSLLWAVWFHIVEFYYKHIDQWIHCLTDYTEWDAIPEGWAKAFGKQYLEELAVAVNKMDEKSRKGFRITDVKEKYGTLRVYTNYGSDEIYKIIDKYEDLSYHTCISCGKPATKLSGGWICPYCDECFDKNSNYEPYAVMVDGKWQNTEWEDTKTKDE